MKTQHPIPIISHIYRALLHGLFGLFLALLLLEPTPWQPGLFSLGTLWTFAIEDHVVRVGVLFLVTPVLGLGWLFFRYVNPAGRRWCWGRPAITLPLLGLTVLILGDISDLSQALRLGGNLGILWVIYLFVLNEGPRPWLALGFVTVVHGGVATAQFLRQGDLGLRFLGEPSLNPAASGTIVLLAGGRRWLRGHGLSDSPNVMATALVPVLLILLPWAFHARGRRRAVLLAICTAGLAGLLATFSRTGWLALAAGSFVWLVWSVRKRLSGWRPEGLGWKRMVPAAGFLLAVGLLFAVANADLIASRFVGVQANPVEAASINERLRATSVSLALIAANPLYGVGTGNFARAGHELLSNVQTVPIAPLRAAAELGLLGAVFWCWLAVAPLLVGTDATRTTSQSFIQDCATPLRIAPWLALLIISLFHAHFWLSGGVQVPTLYGLLAANTITPVKLSVVD